METYPVILLTIVAEHVLRDRLISELQSAGARGYTLMKSMVTVSPSTRERGFRRQCQDRGDRSVRGGRKNPLGVGSRLLSALCGHCLHVDGSCHPRRKVCVDPVEKGHCHER